MYAAPGQDPHPNSHHFVNEDYEASQASPRRQPPTSLPSSVDKMASEEALKSDTTICSGCLRPGVDVDCVQTPVERAASVAEGSTSVTNEPTRNLPASTAATKPDFQATASQNCTSLSGPTTMSTSPLSQNTPVSPQIFQLTGCNFTNITLNMFQTGGLATISGENNNVIPAVLESTTGTGLVTRTVTASTESVVQAVGNDRAIAPRSSDQGISGDDNKSISVADTVSVASTRIDQIPRDAFHNSVFRKLIHAYRRVFHDIFVLERSGTQPFIVMVKLKSGSQKWVPLSLLLDTGSDINLVHPRDVRKLGQESKIEPLKKDQLSCVTFSGHDIKLTGRVSLEWKWKLGKKYRTNFYVVEDDNDAVDELVLGWWSLTNYRMVKICAFGCKSKGIILPKSSKSKLATLFWYEIPTNSLDTETDPAVLEQREAYRQRLALNDRQKAEEKEKTILDPSTDDGNDEQPLTNGHGN